LSRVQRNGDISGSGLSRKSRSCANEQRWGVSRMLAMCAMPPRRNARSLEFDLPEDGDKSLQEQLASSVLWEIQMLGKIQHLDLFVQSELWKFRQELDDQYNKGQNKFMTRSDRLAMLESLGHVSKWNQEFIIIDRETKERQKQIREELAVIDALLRRRAMHEANKKTKSKKRRGNYRSLSKQISDMHPRLKLLSRFEALGLCLAGFPMAAFGLHLNERALEAFGHAKFMNFSCWMLFWIVSISYVSLAFSDLNAIATIAKAKKDTKK